MSHGGFAGPFQYLRKPQCLCAAGACLFKVAAFEIAVGGAQKRVG